LDDTSFFERGARRILDGGGKGSYRINPRLLLMQLPRSRSDPGENLRTVS
jgi:hypothetical protein